MLTEKIFSHKRYPRVTLPRPFSRERVTLPPPPASMGRNPMATKAPQIMWVGAGPAFLPPDGDYPGGSTGIDADGYLAFETLSHEPSHTSSSSSHTYINVTLKSQFTLPPPPLSHAFPSLRVPRSRAFSRAHAHALSWQHAVR